MLVVLWQSVSLSLQAVNETCGSTMLAAQLDHNKYNFSGDINEQDTVKKWTGKQVVYTCTVLQRKKL